MELKELLSKLELIEEQAHLSLDEFPQQHTKERLRMIISLARQIRYAVADSTSASGDPETTVRLPS